MANESSILERCAFLVYNQEGTLAADTDRLERRLAAAAIDTASISAALSDLSAGNPYVRFHALRFMDQVRALATVVPTSAADAKARVLDIGVSPASTLYARYLPIIVQTAGLPSSTPAAATAARYAVEAHHYVDLEVETLSNRHPDLAGTFDAVMFCEVIEHVRASPAEQISDILSTLRPGGHMILTTPNAINRQWLTRLLTGRLLTANYSRARIAAGEAAGYHVREYTMAELCDAAVEAGGEVIERGLRDWYGASQVDAAVPYVSSRHALMLIIRRPQ